MASAALVIGDAFGKPPIPSSPLGFQFADVTNPAGIQFRQNSGAYGGKLLPETLGSGCAFLDYDGDGWQDILLINSMDWPGHRRQTSTLKLYRNNRNGTFSDVTHRAGLDLEMYGMGVAVGDYNNDGFPDILVTCVGRIACSEILARELSWTRPIRADSATAKHLAPPPFGLISTETDCSIYLFAIM